ncbi:MAG: hypothetical protein AAGA66_06550 [Bacteroidota bacterium]
MKDFESIEKLIQTKAFSELSPNERMLAMEVMDENEYDAMHQAATDLKGERMPLKRNVKAELLKELKPQRGILHGLLLKPLPAYSLLILLLLFISTYFLFPKKVAIQTIVTIKEVPHMVKGTVTLIKIDTVWRDRIVKVPAPSFASNQTHATDTAVVAQQPVKSRSISEQSELLDLVVRGE